MYLRYAQPLKRCVFIFAHHLVCINTAYTTPCGSCWLSVVTLLLYLATWSLVYLATWSLVYLVTWSLVYLATWSLVYLVTWCIIQLLPRHV